MPLSDALLVTGLGMAVVFTGLLLTAGLIVAFGVLGRAREARADAAAATPLPASPSSPAGGTTTVPPDVMAVITTVLEVERRLHQAESGGRMTIRRSQEESSR